MKRIAIVASLLLVSLSVLPAFAADKPVTVKGEVVDTFCYSAMGAGGAGHATCGKKCVSSGIPVGLVEGKKMYILLPDKDASPLPKAITDNMGKEVTVTGTVVASGGNTFLRVQSVK